MGRLEILRTRLTDKLRSCKKMPAGWSELDGKTFGHRGALPYLVRSTGRTGKRTKNMKKKMLALVLLAAGSMFAAVEIGIRLPPPPPVRVEVRHASPGPGYSYVAGYWYPVSGHYRWHAGYWSRPPYEGAVWVGPRHDGQQFYNGYWQGEGRERVEHDHASDRAHDRDYHN